MTQENCFDCDGIEGDCSRYQERIKFYGTECVWYKVAQEDLEKLQRGDPLITLKSMYLSFRERELDL